MRPQGVGVCITQGVSVCITKYFGDGCMYVGVPQRQRLNSYLCEFVSSYFCENVRVR